MLKRLSHERNVLTVMHVGMLPRLETALHHLLSVAVGLMLLLVTL